MNGVSYANGSHESPNGYDVSKKGKRWTNDVDHISCLPKTIERDD